MKISDDPGTYPTLADSGDTTNSQNLPRGSNLGRYVIIEPIGSGGMGTVYRAYDPQLNRGVALKILSVKQADQQAAERAKARLIREAQALAQLSHPNVVAVHDAGTFEDDVFIAMELVEGKTLDKWMNEKKRAAKEILEVMRAAGRGLSAAHKAGLVHRDFKPGNVIVGDDGRVRVLDFGLARAADQVEIIEDRTTLAEQEGESLESKRPFDYKEISSDSSPNLLQSPLTHEGGVLGTPLYMAPEQHLGLKTDERTDQFGYCVVLYEALYGRRPFSAATMDKLKREVIRQKVLAPRADSDVPAWLWKIIYKGLSAKPDDRYPTIASLLEDLDKDPEEVRRQRRLARRRKIFVVTSILLMIALPIGVWYGLRYRTFQLCKAAEGEFVSVWDDATKVSIRKAFLSTEKSFALGTWERVEQSFNRYLADWTQMRNDVCEARLLRATQSEELFDLRMGCLRKRIVELEALVRVFAEADEGVVQKAVRASSSLTGIESCADEEALRAPYPPPKNAEVKAKVVGVSEKLVEIEALVKTGQYQEALELIQPLEQEANSIAYQPIQAKVLYVLGNILLRNGEYKTAETTLYSALRAAGTSKDSVLAARVATALTSVVGIAQGRSDDGLLIGRYAEFVIELSGGADLLLSRFLNNLGGVFWKKGDFDNSLESFYKALEIFERKLGHKHPLVAQSMTNIGLVLQEQGEFDKSLEYQQKALAILENEMGPEHPYVATSLTNLGIVLSMMGQHEKAFEIDRRALAIREKTLGPDNPLLALSLYNMGISFANLDKYDQALQCQRKALKFFEKTLGHQHSNLVLPLSSMGVVFVDQGMPNDALAPLERAVKLCSTENCPTQQHLTSLLTLARALVASGGDKARAIKLAKQAREIFEKTPKRFKKELEEVNTWLQKHGAEKLAKKAHK